MDIVMTFGGGLVFGADGSECLLSVGGYGACACPAGLPGCSGTALWMSRDFPCCCSAHALGLGLVIGPARVRLFASFLGALLQGFWMQGTGDECVRGVRDGQGRDAANMNA